MSRSNFDKPFYVDVGTSVVAIRCASNHDVLMRYDYSLRPHSLNFAKGMCNRMNKEVELSRLPRNCDVGTPEEQDKRREPMASNNETVAGIIVEVRTINPCNEYADRIESAHKRELAAKDDERLTIVANYENVIAEKDAEIAKLRTLTTHTDNSEVIAELERRLKVAEKFAAEMKESTNSLVRACGHQMILRLQGEGV